jgi:hypothetical protein
LILKQPTGWFAAGREVAQAMLLLSDGAFKLYLHLCLQADRHPARVALNTAEWMQGLGKDPAWIEAFLGELYRYKVCERHGSGVAICDRFWPYQKQVGLAAAAAGSEFVRQVRTAFLKPASVCSTFTAADHKLALNLYRREVSLEQVRWAICLGCARKSMAMLNGQTRQPITSLAYFAPLIEEAGHLRFPPATGTKYGAEWRKWRSAGCKSQNRHRPPPDLPNRRRQKCSDRFATGRPIFGCPTSIESILRNEMMETK